MPTTCVKLRARFRSIAISARACSPDRGAPLAAERICRLFSAMLRTGVRTRQQRRKLAYELAVTLALR